MSDEIRLRPRLAMTEIHSRRPLFREWLEVRHPDVFARLHRFFPRFFWEPRS